MVCFTTNKLMDFVNLHEFLNVFTIGQQTRYSCSVLASANPLAYVRLIGHDYIIIETRWLKAQFEGSVEVNIQISRNKTCVTVNSYNYSQRQGTKMR